MGYISKDIAVITEPKIISLSAAPNFVTFASKPAVKTYFEANVSVNIDAGATAIPTKTVIRVTDPSGAVYAFHGTTNPDEVGGAVFFVSVDKSDTAQNLREAMVANRWINANLEIRIPFNWSNFGAENGRVLNIKSKGAGSEFTVTITAPNNPANVAYTIAYVNAVSTNNDSISGEATTAEIELDIYENAAVFLGEDDRALTPAKLGTFVTSLQKTYAGAPLWFDVNGLFSQYAKYTLPPQAVGWFNTGTVKTFRFIAKKRGVNSFIFYQSNALFLLSGYGPASEELDLRDYVFDNSNLKLLSNKPRTPYMRGQREFLNFIYEDPFRGEANPVLEFRVIYRAYTTADKYIGTRYDHPISRANLNIVNTCVLNIDAVLNQFPTAAIVRVGLAVGDAIVSNDLEYLIRPDCLHDLRQFTFLNRLGGWDTFNFDSTVRNEIKPAIETYNKTLTPAYKKGESLETVYTSSLADTNTVEGAPVSDEVAEWLKELAAARVVLDGDGNYIIKEDFTLATSKTSQNMQVPTIKYRLSETFTND